MGELQQNIAVYPHLLPGAQFLGYWTYSILSLKWVDNHLGVLLCFVLYFQLHTFKFLYFFHKSIFRFL